MHSIIIKDQVNYEETSMFIAYVKHAKGFFSLRLIRCSLVAITSFLEMDSWPHSVSAQIP